LKGDLNWFWYRLAHTPIISDFVLNQLLNIITLQDGKGTNPNDSIVIGSDSSASSSSDEEHESPNEFFNEDEEDLNNLRMRLQQHKVQSPTIANKTVNPTHSAVIISPPNTLIAGRVINFASGFKIPKRPRFLLFFLISRLAMKHNLPAFFSPHQNQYKRFFLITTHKIPKTAQELKS
jgi:hypothetical protein